MFLFQDFLRNKNIKKIDHRSKECDFKYQKYFPAIPSFDIKLADISSLDNIIIVGAMANNFIKYKGKNISE